LFDVEIADNVQAASSCVAAATVHSSLINPMCQKFAGVDTDPDMCQSYGDPHYVSFAGKYFDCHIVGWNVIFEHVSSGLVIEANHTAWGTSHQLVGGLVSVTAAIRASSFCGSTFYTIGRNFYIDDGFVSTASLTQVESFYNNIAIRISAPDEYTVHFLLTNVYLRMRWFSGANIWNVYLSVPRGLGGIKNGLCVTGVCAQTAPTLPTVFGGAITREQAYAVCAKLVARELLDACMLDVFVLGSLSYADLALEANTVLQAHKELYQKYISSASRLSVSISLLFTLALIFIRFQ
jgi:hypothetical protein